MNLVGEGRVEEATYQAVNISSERRYVNLVSR